MYSKLSKQHIRELKSLIAEADFRCDIIGNLPIELVALVFQYLDLVKAFQFRRVSRKWFKLLSSESLIKSILEPWRLSGDSRLTVPQGTTPSQTLDLIAEIEDAFRTGKAFSTLSLTADDRPTTHGYFSYSQGYLAWLEGGENSQRTVVHHIESGKRWYRVTPDRLKIHKLAVSSDLLAVISYQGKCHIWAHSDQEIACTVCLPSISDPLIGAFADNIIILSDGITSPKSSFILMRCSWDKQSVLSSSTTSSGAIRATSREFATRLFPYSKGWTYMMVNTSGNCVILVHRYRDADHPGLYLKHFDYEGNVEFEGHIPDRLNGMPRECHLSVSECFNSKSECIFSVWSFSKVRTKTAHTAKGSYSSSELIQYIHAMYHPSKRTVEIKVQKILDPDIVKFYDEPSLLCKGILYKSLKDTGKKRNEFMVLDAERDVLCFVGAHHTSDNEPSEIIRLFGDETFVVRLKDNVIDVWCFDKHLQMAGESLEFKRKGQDIQRLPIELKMIG